MSVILVGWMQMQWMEEPEQFCSYRSTCWCFTAECKSSRPLQKLQSCPWYVFLISYRSVL